MPAYHDFVAPNKEYAANFGDKTDLPLPPAKKLTIVTCMDARINVYAELGIKEGDAHIIRNAGGVVYVLSATLRVVSLWLIDLLLIRRRDALRSILSSHNDSSELERSPSSTIRVDSDPSNTSLAVVDDIQFLEFSNLEQSVRDDVQFLKESPLVLPETVISGWVYEVETGKIRQIV
ncbi:hypothetical protein NLI96_g4432 [Meripilus lineatus]|uniref:Carbonic anhydrase n=1 Tax=Meripilus lineatus TaxID=2056292 RepID=A0AAD5V4J6_9APHY|nr:hypothetical protein NLI96_g4432 [Physisporinus lineatus]